MADIIQWQNLMHDLMATSGALALAQQAADEGGIIDLFDAARGFIFPTGQDKLDALTDEGIPLWARQHKPY